MGASTKKTANTGNGVAREELGRELKHLRALVREVGEQFILRREGDIEAIIANLSAVPSRKLRVVAPDLLHDIRGLKVKPAKGRLKDVKGIDKLIDLICDRISTAQEERKRPGKKSGKNDAG